MSRQSAKCPRLQVRQTSHPATVTANKSHSYPETVRYRVLVLFSGPESTDGGIDTYLKRMGIDEVIMVDILNDMKFQKDLSGDRCWKFWLDELHIFIS